jgi:hypothetical protein
VPQHFLPIRGVLREPKQPAPKGSLPGTAETGLVGPACYPRTRWSRREDSALRGSRNNGPALRGASSSAAAHCAADTWVVRSSISSEVQRIAKALDLSATFGLELEIDGPYPALPGKDGRANCPDR